MIEAGITERQLVSAGPGEGKTAVACARIAHLIRQGVAPTRTLLISFTRTAVAELRARIGDYLGDPRAATEVQLSTIDSHAWQLRQGFDAVTVPNVFGQGTYEASISSVTELLRARDVSLLDYLERFEHVLIDEAQDIVGARADLIWALTQALPTSCGVTVFADPAQAIYGFTADEAGHSFDLDLTERLTSEAKPAFVARQLGTLYRVSTPAMRALFEGCREITLTPRPGAQHLTKLQRAIESNATESLGTLTHEELAEWCRNAPSDMLLLFRHRVDALCVASYCAKHAIPHRLRLSGAPTIVHPWIGVMLWRATGNRLLRTQWSEHWAERCPPGVARGMNVDSAWKLIYHAARGSGAAESIDLERLRGVLARPRPPSELCVPDWGWNGPTLGTIHASKGREAPRVALVVFDAPAAREESEPEPKRKTISVAERNAEQEQLRQEGRVLYVGATRARDALLVAQGRGSSGQGLPSGRTVRYTSKPGLMQFEVGREGDVERFEHLTWPGAEENQERLVRWSAGGVELYGHAHKDWGYRLRMFARDEQAPVGQLAHQVTNDRNLKWRKGTMPRDLSGFQLVGATTVALRDSERSAVPEPFRSSGFALAPVVRGFAFQQFAKKTR
ncbi:MAG: UvrD-helicase domain-containing protein [Deltaproteobacteria bacterium]|nr:UvrD-helicase domain-containing protein [Deltaproteobacteria bacterium]